MTLPVFQIRENLLKTLSTSPVTVLQAPPGSGKTSQVPLWLLDQTRDKILLVEPRRLAVLNAAGYLAHQLEEKPGQTVGYRMRQDSCTGPETRIEVVTEGVFIRMLQDDPALEEFAYVLLDEFHERNLLSDLGIAFLRYSQSQFREDLHILLMSATLDASRLTRILNAPLIECSGTLFPVATRYQTPHSQEPLTHQVCRAICSVSDDSPGTILVFLPGLREIQDCAHHLEQSLQNPDKQIQILHGSLSRQEQEQVLRSCQSERIILSSPIAESSLTLHNISTVIDSGLYRQPVYDSSTGLQALHTRRISRASADQRSGRAGRTRSGACIRLWPESQQDALQPYPVAEIENADYLTLRMELAAWGTTADELHWLTPPSTPRLMKAAGYLCRTGALISEDAVALTEHGRAMLRLPCHPRLAHMVIQHPGDISNRAAVMLQERPVPTGEISASWFRQPLTRTEQQLIRRLPPPPSGADESLRALLSAFPERIALAENNRRIRTTAGKTLEAPAQVRNNQWLIALKHNESHLISWLPLKDWTPEQSDLPVTNELVCELISGRLTARRICYLDRLKLSETPCQADDNECQQLWESYLASPDIIDDLPWTDKQRLKIRRIEWTAELLEPEGWPLSPGMTVREYLYHRREEFIIPFCSGIRSVNALPLEQILSQLLDWNQQRLLDEALPETIRINQRPRKISYRGEFQAVVSVKLQEAFGMKQTPLLAYGKLPVIMELLSPAGRPLQITADLSRFWENSYPQIRKEMRGRYPKHPWPENGADSQPTALTRRALANKD